MKEQKYTFWDDSGDAEIVVYEVFPGVQLAYHSVHMDRLRLDSAQAGNLIEIHHCREGRIEQAFGDDFFYLMPGDLSIARKKKMVDAYHFPLRHYHGITIGVDADRVEEGFAALLKEIRIQPARVAEMLCSDKLCFILRGNKQIEHVFSELYSVPESIREGYFKIKILELFLVLGNMHDYKNHLPERTQPSGHVHLANRVAAYLMENMEQHITISELSRKFDVSDTHLKAVFKGVYGMPVFSYMRLQRMQAAGRMLVHTDKPITGISEAFGYANAGKFSAAFLDVMGETPSEYRKAHRH